MLNIITNPLVYAKLRWEIDEAISSGSISSPIQVDEAVKLSYLQACIKEGLRVFPPVASLRARVTPPEGDDLNGYFVPGGVVIGFNSRAMQRHQVYGSDPGVFRPERWLEPDTERTAEMEKVHSIIFGHGGTKCLGIRIANLTLNKFFVEVSATHNSHFKLCRGRHLTDSLESSFYDALTSLSWILTIHSKLRLTTYFL